MNKPSHFRQSDSAPARARRYVVATIAFLVLALTATQIFLRQPSIGNPKLVYRTFQLWATTVLVILALLILATILGRNLIKLHFERKSGQVGSRFKSKMVSIFIALSLLPAVLMFSLAYWLVMGRLEQWLNTPAEVLQENSKIIAQRYYDEAVRKARDFAAGIAVRAGAYEKLDAPLPPDLNEAVAQLRLLGGLHGVRLYNTHRELSGALGEPLSSLSGAELTSLVGGALGGGSDSNVKISSIQEGDAVWATSPIRNRNGNLTGAVVIQMNIPDVRISAQKIEDAYQRYSDLQREKSTVQFTTLLVFVLSTLLIVFGFSWFGMYLAKRITVPIQALAEGAAAVTTGNLDYRVDCAAFDELEDLVTSFNHMTTELRENKAHIEAAQKDLHETNVQLDDRRRTIETLLQAIPAGVIVLDCDQRIRTMNRTAIQMLDVREQGGDFHLEDLVKGSALHTLRLLLRKSSALGPVVRDIELNLEAKTLHLATTVTPLVDSSEQHAGWVIVLDDLTELLRAEKMSAWQEVARRLAHEIKNPLTPIQLSAERMLHRFRQIQRPGGGGTGESLRAQLEAYGKLLAESVQTIIREADSLKTLVDEFSGFARLPGVRLQETDLHAILENALSLYNGRVQGVRIDKLLDPALPLVLLDAEQIKRAFINLLDNALEAMAENGDRPKVLKIRTSRNPQQRSVRIEISDTGRGFPKEYQDSLFLPYFSTRKGGTGLGLAIVRQVISDHHGQVRAEPNPPMGTKIVIDLPLASS